LEHFSLIDQGRSIKWLFVGDDPCHRVIGSSNTDLSQVRVRVCLRLDKVPFEARSLMVINPILQVVKLLGTWVFIFASSGFPDNDVVQAR